MGGLAKLCHFLLELLVFDLYFFLFFFKSDFLPTSISCLHSELLFFSFKSFMDFVHFPSLLQQLCRRWHCFVLVKNWYLRLLFHINNITYSSSIDQSDQIIKLRRWKVYIRWELLRYYSEKNYDFLPRKLQLYLPFPFVWLFQLQLSIYEFSILTIYYCSSISIPTFFVDFSDKWNVKYPTLVQQKIIAHPLRRVIAKHFLSFFIPGMIQECFKQ